MRGAPSRPLGADPPDAAEIERIVRAAGTSFYRGMRVLPPDRRLAMYAIYAFCRQVDDIADEPGAFEAKVPALEAWRSRVAGLYRGAADNAVARVLSRAVQAYDLREADFVAVIDGMAMDARTAIVAPDWATLDLYCDRVAVAVGRLSVRAFGDASAEADRVAHALGRALQLTNILRDVAEDSARGRLYLPAEFLAEAGVPAEPVLARAHPALAGVCARVAGVARAYFDEAHAAMGRCDRRAMRPARLMGDTYAAILARLERRGWQALDVSARLPKWQKLWIAARHGLA